MTKDEHERMKARGKQHEEDGNAREEHLKKDKEEKKDEDE